MDILLQVVLLVVGFAMLMKGADWFVDGASKLADKFGIPRIVIGLTIVAFGTSAPEAAVRISAALQGSVDLAVSNVLGSNILNIFFILGCSATITPISLAGFSPVDFYVLLFSSLLIYVVTRFGGRAVITRIEGLLLIAVYIAYTVYLIMGA